MQRYPESKIIEVIRDGRDVCVSLEKYALTQKWCPKSRRKQILLWKHCIEKGIELSNQNDFTNRILKVKYEDISNNKIAEMEKMFEFAELKYSKELLENISQKTDIRSIKNKGNGQHVRKGVVADWKNCFNAEDIELFKKLAGDLLCHLGYKW